MFHFNSRNSQFEACISIQTVIFSRFLRNLRRTQLPHNPSHPSDIRTSGFRIPSISDIVEDMGRPLDHGLQERDAEIEENFPEAVITGPSFVEGSSTWAGAVTIQSQASQCRSTSSVRFPLLHCSSFPLTHRRKLSRPTPREVQVSAPRHLWCASSLAEETSHHPSRFRLCSYSYCPSTLCGSLDI